MVIFATKTMTVKSPAFDNMNFIPEKFACSGENVNPALYINNIPENTRSLALVIEDPDATGGTFDHWVVWNIPVKEKIEEDSIPGAEGKNGRGDNKYMGPCPAYGTHHYHFKIFAIDTKLDLPLTTTKNALLNAIEGHVLAKAEIIGLFERSMN